MKIVIIAVCFISSVVCSYELNNVHNYRGMAKSSLTIEGAGMGWDYLTEDIKYPPQIISFKENKKTSDGKYLIPDCFAVEAVKKTKYTDLADVISTTYSFVSKTAKSVKIGGSIGVSMGKANVSVGGSYSKDFFETIEEQRTTNTVTTRTKYIDHRYTLLSNSRCPLDNKFVAAIGDLVFAVDMGEEDLATYLAQVLIDDYGTHMVKKVKIGGTIYNDDYIYDEFWSKMKDTASTVQTAASISFSYEKIDAAASFESNKTITAQEYEEFKRNIKRSYMDAIGGAYTAGMSVKAWSETLDANLVALDREADLLSNLVLGSNFPMFPMMTVFKANAYVQNAIATYLNVNSIDGCLDRNSVNFNPQANFDSGNMCDEKLKFGGTILSGSCSQSNVLTNSATCPGGYVAKTLTSSQPSFTLTQCLGGDGVKNGAVLFGGVYSSMVNNQVTGGKSCPPFFKPQGLFDCADNFICVSTDINNGVRSAIPFGGFVSECFNEPERTCPQGFETHLINVINGCQFSYCTRIKRFSRPLLSRPPFVPKPPSFSMLRFNPYKRFY